MIIKFRFRYRRHIHTEIIKKGDEVLKSGRFIKVNEFDIPYLQSISKPFRRPYLVITFLGYDLYVGKSAEFEDFADDDLALYL